MKIDKPGKPLPPNLTGEATPAATKGKSNLAPALQQSGSTNVSLGSTATQLQDMENSMANSPVVDVAKVAEIRQAISDGRFKVNTEVVADRLLETVRDLVGNK